MTTGELRSSHWFRAGGAGARLRRRSGWRRRWSRVRACPSRQSGLVIAFDPPPAVIGQTTFVVVASAAIVLCCKNVPAKMMSRPEIDKCAPDAGRCRV
jgi:hypothetical protein